MWVSCMWVSCVWDKEKAAGGGGGGGREYRTKNKNPTRRCRELGKTYLNIIQHYVTKLCIHRHRDIYQPTYLSIDLLFSSLLFSYLILSYLIFIYNYIYILHLTAMFLGDCPRKAIPGLGVGPSGAAASSASSKDAKKEALFDAAHRSSHCCIDE